MTDRPDCTEDGTNGNSPCRNLVQRRLSRRSLVLVSGTVLTAGCLDALSEDEPADSSDGRTDDSINASAESTEDSADSSEKDTDDTTPAEPELIEDVPTVVEEYLIDVPNFEGVLYDFTGRPAVTIMVGGGDNGLTFEPPAVRIDPGTTVRWEWTGKGGAHNVTADVGLHDVEEPLYDSNRLHNDPIDTADGVFEFTFEDTETGIYPYHCFPHEAVGMKGIIQIGDDETVPAVGGDGAARGEWDGPTNDSADDDDAPTEIGESPPGVPAAAHAFLVDNEANLYEDSVADRQGQAEVTVHVGAGDIAFAFDPPAVRIDPGTTVRWEWTGEGGPHNVASTEPSDSQFRSGDPVPAPDETWAHTFTTEGIYTYHCEPHAAAGMHGVIIVAPENS